MANIKIGILGGGQLARMSAYQAYKLGFDVSIMEKKINSPAGMLTKNDYPGWVDSKELLTKFIDEADIFTLENEFIDSGYLKVIEDSGKKVYPSSETIGLIQDKYIQKKTFRSAGLPVPEFLEIKNDDSYASVSAKLGNKFIIKSRKLGYDGYGNAMVTDDDSFADALEKLSKRHNMLMAEEFVSFTKELAIMVVRNSEQTKKYPVVETIQKSHICHTVIAPAEINETSYNNVQKIAEKAVEAVKGYGLFGIEFFITGDGKVLINEMAPRPHNSGHYTIEGCVTSQFENHIRAVLDLPLGKTDLVKKYAVMVNLLGKREGEGHPLNYNEILHIEDAHLHIYGKSDDRPGRKMGHVTLIGDNLEELVVKANLVADKIDL